MARIMGIDPTRAVSMVVLATVIVATVLTLAPGASAATGADVRITVGSTASGALDIGDAFSYEVGVANHGSAVAKGVVIEDDLPVGVAPTVIVLSLPQGSCSVASSQQPGSPPHTSAYCSLPTLAAGASVSVTIPVRVTRDVSCGTITNAPWVAARNEPASATTDDTATVSDTVTCPPSLAIVVRAPSYAHVGDAVRVTMALTNDGSTDLTDVRTRNAACTNAISFVDDGNGDATLASGESWRYGCDARVTPATGLRLAARATASARAGDAHVRVTARTTVRVLRPSLSVRVSPDPVSGSPGETIEYHYMVRNTGDAAVSHIDIADDRLGLVGRVQQLAPGHTATFTVERRLRADDVWVVNEVSATGSDPSGRAVTASDTASVTIVAPAAPDGSRHPQTRGGTAFTGSDATLPAAIAAGLALIGSTALLVARRRRV